MSLMSRTPLRSTAVKASLAAVVIAAASAGALTGMAAASASPKAHPAATAPIDHQLCYAATTTMGKIPPGIQLQNQFSTTPFPIQIGHAMVHCNPVKKTVLTTGQVFPINYPNDHLLCWQITEPTQPAPAVVAANQFGSATLTLSQPNLLCLPSWKSLTGPPVEKTPAPPGLGHFACYPVVSTSNPYNPPPVSLQDEFAKTAVDAQVQPVPTELCVPTAKIVAGKIYPIIKPGQNLLCFPVTPTPIIPRVFDLNQFGHETVTIQKTNWLCPPTSIKPAG